MRSRSWSRFRNGLDGDWLPPRKLDRSSCSHGSILLLWMLRCLEVKCTLDMNLPICPVPHRRGSWNTVPSPRSSWYLHLEHTLINWGWSGRLCDFFVRDRAASFLSLCHWSEAFCLFCRRFCWHHHGLWIVLSNKFHNQYYSAVEFVARVRYCSVDTELTDGNDCAKNQFGCVVVTTEKYGEFPFSFAFQISSFQSTGSTECGMPASAEVGHDVLSDTIPFSILFVRVIISFLIQAQETTNVRARIVLRMLLRFGNSQHIVIFVSLFSPYNVVVHWHEDDPSWELPKFTLYSIQSSCSGSRRDICNVVNPREFVHSNSINSP